MDKVIVAFNDNPEAEIEKMDGVITEFSWDSLLPSIGSLIRLRPDEIIDGLVVTDESIKVKISRKKGRKSKSKIDPNQSKINIQ